MLRARVPSVREGRLPVILQNTCRWKCVLYIDEESFIGKSVRLYRMIRCDYLVYFSFFVEVQLTLFINQFFS